MSQKTDINEKIFSEKNDIDETLDEDTLDKSIVDLSLTLKTRIRALNMFYKKSGADDTIELIIKLSAMYELSGTKTLRTYLFAICEQSDIDSFLKTFAAKSIHSHNDKDELGYKAIDMIYPQLGSDIGTPYKIDFLKMLMKNDDYKQQCRKHLCDTINDQKIDCNYRYKAILGLENKDEKLRKKMDWFIREGCLEFLKCDQNDICYRVLAGQYLLQNCTLSEEENQYIQDKVLEFAENEQLEYNLRADATDVLLQLGTGKNKKRAQEIIMILGRAERVVKTMYDNAQNVHTVEIEKSVEEAIEFLHSFNIMKHNDEEIDIVYVENKIKKMIKGSNNEEKINVSLNRIYMDRALYSKYNCTLSNVLLRVWTYIIGHKHEEEMLIRLLEELEEMSGTCSSGFVTRLINTISGFGDFSMRISWREQIIANLTGRLNARIRDMDNLNLQEKVMDQMTLETDKFSERKHFLKFFRKNILSIREEMYEEFKEHVNDTDFDLYFRAGVSMYETGKFV